MPKETFFNLPEEKKERIIEAALEEFAARPYHKARITVIADNADIAKGSFYQYFADKKDLVKYIIELTVQSKLDYINHDMLIHRDRYHFFQLLREICASGIRFAKAHPRRLAMANKVLQDKDLLREILGEHEDKSIFFFKDLLRLGIEKGDLDPEIDVDFIARLLAQLNYSLGDLLYKDGEIDLDDQEPIDRLLHFIENGIKKGR